MLQVNDISQAQSLEKVTLFNSIPKETVAEIVALIQGAENPIKEAKEAYDFLASRISKNKTTTVGKSIELQWSIDGAPKKTPLEKLVNNFKPNSIEKVAAWLAVITISMQLLSKEPATEITINNEFILQSQQSLEIHINRFNSPERK